MELVKKKINGVFEIVPESHEDFRGFLVRIWDNKIFKEFGLKADWVQESHSYTKEYLIS